MSDVTVRKIKKMSHVEGCKKLRTCTCPFEFEEGWMYDVRFKWPSGKAFREKKQVPLPGPKLSESRALAWARERYRQIVASGEPPLVATKVVEVRAPTLAEFKETYLRHKTNQRLKASTEHQREGHLRTWIIPVLGSHRLDEIDLTAIDLLKEAMEERSEKHVNNVLANLSNMLRVAKSMKVIKEMPVESVGLFKVDNSKPPPFYTEEEYGRLVSAALEVDLRVAAIVLLGGDAGLRSGEIRAFPPYGVKWDTNQLHIDRQVWRDVVDSPKSGRGRVIPMTDRLSWVLRKLGRVKGDTLLLGDDGKRFSSKRVRSLVKRAQHEAGLAATGNVHILRHSFCTHLAMAGKPPTVIQELAGHRHLTTTMRYMHVVKGAKEDAIKALNRPLPTGVAPAAIEEAGSFGRILAAEGGQKETP